MKKRVFLSVLVALTLFVWAGFLLVSQPYSSLARFTQLRERIAEYASMSTAAEPSFMEFTESGNALILALPSATENNTVDFSGLDRSVLLGSRGAALFTVYPSASSLRKHETFLIRNVDSLSVTSGGSVATVSAVMWGRKFSAYFFINPAFVQLPGGGRK